MSDEHMTLPPEPGPECVRDPASEPAAQPGPAPVFTSPPEPAAPTPSAHQLITSTLVLYGALSVVAVIWGLIDGGRNIFFAPGSSGLAKGLMGAAAGLGLGLVTVVLSRLTTRWFAWARAVHREFHTLLAGLTTGQALVLALASAVGEEALFRGAALPTLGLIWSSVLFGAAHVPVRRGLWPWPFMAFGMGLVFGWLYLRFGDLSGPILAHATINFLNLRHIAKTSL